MGNERGDFVGNQAGGKAIIFNTITVSDGISMGTEGMKYSLVSRLATAGSSPTPSKPLWPRRRDGFVAIGGCDKNMPGALMAIARLNRPAEHNSLSASIGERAGVWCRNHLLGTILPGCITMNSQQAALN